MSNAPAPVTKDDLLDAAWERYQASLAAFRAREALAAAGVVMTAKRNAYTEASARSERALRNFEHVEQRLLLQESQAPKVRAVAS